MSDYIDTREGWREVGRNTPLPNGGLIEFDENGHPFRQWVREEPMPPLPTVPYTVIRVTWRGNVETPCEAMLDPNGDWWLVAQSGGLSAEDLAVDVESFEVLSEPRAVTARAVIVRVRKVLHSAYGQVPSRIPGPEMDAIAREFGVDQ